MEVKIIKINYNNSFNDNNNKDNDNNYINKFNNCYVSDNSYISNKAIIKFNSYIVDSKVDDYSEVFNSVIEKSEVGKNVKIGPFSHLRPNSKIMDNAKIGNYVEIKNSIIGENTKVSHLAYVGDSVVGKNCNIGCGVIFCNYNGKEKNKIIIGDNCFIGSNCNLIAPLIIADNTYICAGTTVTSNSNNNDFVIGRAKAITKVNRASKYLKE